jgi:predicted metal-dependent hydrolase
MPRIDVDTEAFAFIDRSLAERRHAHAVEILDEIARSADNPDMNEEGLQELAVSRAATERDMAMLGMWLTQQENQTEVA